MTKRKIIKIIVIAFIVSLIITIIPYKSVKQQGYVCENCGALKGIDTVRVLGILLSRSINIEDSDLTALRTELIGPCEHNWVDLSTYHRTFGIFGEVYRSIGCAMPYGRYPACGNSSDLAKGIAKLKDDTAKVKALRAIADQGNFSKWFACDILIEVGQLQDDEFDAVNWPEWWSGIEKYFKINYDRNSISALLDDFPERFSTYRSLYTLGLLEEDDPYVLEWRGFHTDTDVMPE